MLATVSKRAIQYGYAGVQFASDGIEFGSSVYFETSSLSFGLFFGVASGLLSYVTTWYFQCAEIDEYFEEYYGLEKPDEKSKAQEAALMGSTIAWLYTTGRSLQKVGDNYFQMQAMLGWYQALKQNKDLEIKRLPLGIFVGVIAYTILCNLPFMLSNEMHQACEELDPAGKKNKTLPTNTLLKPFIALSNRWLNGLIIWLGSFTHSLESLTSMFMMIPPQSLIKLFTYGQLYFVLGMSGLGIIAALFFSVHLVQTLFFEGDYSKNNLKNISGADLGKLEIQNKAQYLVLSGSSYLLWTQSILHGLDDSLPIVALLSTLGFGYTAYIIGLVTTIISMLGTQMSEVYHAGHSTAEALNDYNIKHPAPA